LRFYAPTSGVITVDGRDIGTYNIGWLRAQMGLVLQEPVLFEASIADNIAYGLPSDTPPTPESIVSLMPRIEAAARAANAHDFVSALRKGYGTYVGSKGAQLSGGQRQRIAIARALIRSPQVLLFDEATSALDTKSERVVQSAIDGLLASTRCTSITIAHRLSTIASADRIVVLTTGGAIAESGTVSHDGVVQPPTHLPPPPLGRVSLLVVSCSTRS